VITVFIAISLFIYYCYWAYKKRIRKQVDEQVKLSLISVVMLLLPVLFLILVIVTLILTSGEQLNLIISYGFIIFFGWITAIIMGMTFKTLPFIVWNKVYHHLSGLGKTPSPKDLFNNPVFKIMAIAYLAGFIIFTLGILFGNSIVLKLGAIFLLITAVLYNWNVLKVLMHKPIKL
jgi:L-asparagine transporter-like permease